MIQHEQANNRGEISVLSLGVYYGNELRKSHVATRGDLLERLPERIFQADARLVPCKDYRSLDDKRLHDNQTPHVASLLQRRDIGAVK